MSNNIITFKSHFGWFLFDIEMDKFLELVRKEFITEELWFKDIWYILNNKYLIDKERMWYSDEKEFVKVYKKIWEKLWLPKWHFYLVWAPFLALLADLNNLKFKYIEKKPNKIKWFELLQELQLFKHQQKIVDKIVDKGTNQINLIKDYLPTLLENRITYANLSTDKLVNLTKQHFPFLENDVYAGYVISPARSGKTITMLALAQQLKLRTLVIVGKELIFNQFKNRIKQFTNLDIENECRFYQWKTSFGKFNDDVQIWVGMIQTLSKLFMEPDPKKIDIIKEELSQYDLILVDEAHGVATQTFMSAISWIHHNKIFWFTATRMRWDGNNKLLDYYIGNTIIRIEQNEVWDMVYNINIYPKKYIVKEPLWFLKTKRTRSWPVEYLDKWAVKNLYNDNARNNMIVDMVIDAIKNDRLIIVIWEMLDHLDYLQWLINDKVKKLYQTDKDVAYVINSKTKKKDRQAILEAFDIAWKKRAEYEEFYPKVLLATAWLLWEGFDWPYFDTIFLTAPLWAKKKERWDDGRGNLVQVINRIWNKVPWKKQPICVDIIDIEPEGVLVNMARSRFWNVYKDKYRDLKHNFYTKWDWSFLNHNK